jgi:hypothetical protein
MIYIYVMLQIALILLSIGGYFQVKTFLGQYSSVSDPIQLSAFKSLVRANMYIALVYLVLGIPTILLSIYIGFVFGLLGITFVAVVNMPHFLFGRHLRSLEKKARNLQCAAYLSDDYRRIGETWFKKALPDF